MTLEIGNTELDYIIPGEWSMNLLEAFYEDSGVVGRMAQVSGEVAAYGDILHLPAMPTISVNDVGADGALTKQQLSLTEAQLTVNKWKEATVEIIDKAAKQAKIDMIAAFRKDFPGPLLEQLETDALGLYSDVTTNTQGSSTVNADEDMLTAGIAQLLALKFGRALRDPNRATFVWHTSQWSVLKKLKILSDASLTGLPQGGAVSMKIPDIYGIPTLFSAVVVSASSARQNLLFLREAFAVGIQSNLDVREFNTGLKLTKAVGANILYGVKTRKENRAVLFKTKA